MVIQIKSPINNPITLRLQYYPLSCSSIHGFQSRDIFGHVVCQVLAHEMGHGGTNAYLTVYDIPH